MHALPLCLGYKSHTTSFTSSRMPNTHSFTPSFSLSLPQTMTQEKNTRESLEKGKKDKKSGWAKIRDRPLIEQVMTFNKITTCHGPGHVLRNRGTFFGLLWALVTLLFFSVLITIFSQVTREYFQREIQSQVSKKNCENG